MSPKVGIGIAVGAAVAAVVVLAMTLGGRAAVPGQEGEYFYDIQTGKPYIAPAGSIPPVATEAGEGKGVEAVTMGCDSCDTTFIAYLRTLTPEGRDYEIARMDVGNDPQVNLADFPHLKRHMVPADELVAAYSEGVTEDAITWHPVPSTEGNAIVQSASAKCAGAKLVRCNPS